MLCGLQNLRSPVHSTAAPCVCSVVQFMGLVTLPPALITGVGPHWAGRCCALPCARVHCCLYQLALDQSWQSKLFPLLQSTAAVAACTIAWLPPARIRQRLPS